MPDSGHAWRVAYEAYWRNGRRELDKVQEEQCPCGAEAEHTAAPDSLTAVYLGGEDTRWRTTASAADATRARQVACEAAKALSHLHHPLLQEAASTAGKESGR